MKRQKFLIVFASLIMLGVAGSSYSQTSLPSPGETIVGLSRDITGTATAAVVSVTGCPTPVCFSNSYNQIHCTNVYTGTICYTNSVPILSCVTNFITYTHCYTNTTAGTVLCYTNMYPKLSCTTNGFETVVRCYSNAYVRVCSTNAVTSLVCTNDFGPTPILRVRQTVDGLVAANATCDELGDTIPADAVFHATLTADLRQPDWRGFHSGYFFIASGTNIIATGSMTGVNGVVPQGAPCAVCNHFEGSLRGVGKTGGPLSGKRIQADYSGLLTDVTCPSASVPQGAMQMSIDGLVIGYCAAPPGPQP